MQNQLDQFSATAAYHGAAMIGLTTLSAFFFQQYRIIPLICIVLLHVAGCYLAPNRILSNKRRLALLLAGCIAILICYTLVTLTIHII